MFVIKYDIDSWFLGYEEANPISQLTWTGKIELAKTYPYCTDTMLEDLEIMMDEEYLPLTIEEIKAKVCTECHGKGTKWMGMEAEVECPSCEGSGVETPVYKD
jgi:rubrerythrin